MTRELTDYFHDLATVEREIRAELDRYKGGLLTPEDVGVRIRMHPSLAITSKLKMQRAVKASMSFAGQRAQTLRFYKDRKDWLSSNFKAGENLLNRLVADGKGSVSVQGRPHKGYLGVPSSQIRKFLSEYKIHHVHVDMREDSGKNLMDRYIVEENEKGRLLIWNVVLVTRDVTDNELGTVSFGPHDDVPLIRRSRDPRRGEKEDADIKALMSEGDGALDIDLPSEELGTWLYSELPEKRLKHAPDRGLLLLYPIAKNSPPLTKQKTTRVALDTADHVLGIALVFPKLQVGVSDATISYMTVDLSGVPREILTDEDIEGGDQ